MMSKQELKRAERNRRMVAHHRHTKFYREQTHAVEQWSVGKPKPPSVVVGDLPLLDRRQFSQNQTTDE